MRLFFKLLFISILLKCSNIVSQSEEKNKCPDCQLYMEPIFGENFIMGKDKNTVERNFSNFEKVKLNLLGNLPDSDIEYFKANKNITLPNNIKSVLEIEFGFKNDKLVKFSFLINIGDNKDDYFKKLITIIKKNDEKKINSFLYESDEYFFYELKNNCRKIFSLSRNPNNTKEFNLDVRYSYEGN